MSKDLARAVLYGLPPTSIVVKVNGSDSIGLATANGDDLNSRLLRVLKLSYTGGTNATIRVTDGDIIQITRNVYGWNAISSNNVKTIEKHNFIWDEATSSLVSVDLIKDPPVLDLSTSLQHKAVQRLITDIVGDDNIVAVMSNVSVTSLRIENTLKLNRVSQESGVVYECVSPGKGRILTTIELERLREQYKQQTLPGGAIYIKVPTEAREIVMCGNPETINKYLHALNSSVNYKLFDQAGTYLILPNVNLGV